MTRRYSILGAGAMGSVFGAKLAMRGHSVELLTRSPEHPEAIRRQGGLRCRFDGQEAVVPLNAEQVEQAHEAEVVLLFTKTHQLEPALQQLPPALRGAWMVTLQNGLGNGEKVAHYAGLERTVEGVSLVPAEYLGPGAVASSGSAETWMYAASGKAEPLVEQVGQDLTEAGLKTTVTPEVGKFIWQKACFNIAMNALCGLTQGSPGMLEHFSDGKALAHEIADEALQVARVAGISVEAAQVHELIDYACSRHTYHRPSMLQDLLAERLTEIEALNGFLIRMAERHDVPVPLSTLLTRMIRLRERAPAFWVTETPH